jgi:MFS family permease
LYDHLPGILAGFPALFFLVLALLSLPYRLEGWQDWAPISEHAIFWIGMAITILWYIAFRFNLPKRRFWLVFGLLGTFVGIPVILEITGYIKPFEIIGTALGSLKPSASSGAWLVGAMTFGIIWFSNFVWSRTHLRVKMDETGLTIKRVGGKGERFDLIGLKIEDEPIDYLETFMLGVGSLSLKTRMNKPIFTMNRVIGLYRIPIFPFRRGTLHRVEEVLSYQGKVLSVDATERADMAEAADAFDDEAHDEDAHEVDSFSADGEHEADTSDSPEIK